MAQDNKKRLHETEGLYQSLVNLSPDAILVLSNGKFVFANPEAAKILAARSPEDIVGKDVLEFVHPDYRQWVMQRIGQVYSGLISPPKEIKLIRLDGVVIDAETRGAQVEFGGKPAVQIVMRDITERKRAEFRLAFQAGILSSVQDAIIATDEGLRVTYWNKVAEEMYGWTEEEAIGRNTAELFQTKFPDSSRDKVLKKLIVTGFYKGEVLHRCKNGIYITVHASSTIIKGQQGEFKGLVNSIRDITERKQAEESLRQNEQNLAVELYAAQRLQQVSIQLIQADAIEVLYEQILETVVAILHADFASIQMLYPERETGGELRLLGYRGFNEQAVKFWEWVRPTSKSPCGVAMCTHQRVVVPDVETCDFMIGSDDRETCLRAGIRSVQTTPLLSRSGSLLGMLSTHWREVHKLTAFELRILDVLARQAADLIDRKQAEEALRKADKQKDDFLSVLSHELRNPLAVIRNSISILDRAAPEGAQAKRARDVINRQAGQLSHLVDDLLDITRITQNKIKLKRESHDLNELVRRTVEDYRLLFEKNGVCLEMKLTPAAIFVNGDETRLIQVVGNLLQNAAKFTSRGESTLISTERDSVQQQALIRVVDTGVGIAPELIPRLFQSFMQADTSLDRGQGGLGLGLALSKGLIELHGGNISVYSAGLGKGSEFLVRLPLEDIKVEEPQASPQEVPHRNRRVLIIDDNLDLARSLFELLELCEHEVTVAYDGSEGLEKAREFKPEVLLCDIGLPGMDGYEVARAFRADEALKEVFLVALTGYAQSTDQLKAAKAGFVRHLAKPVDLGALERVLAEIPVK